MIQLSHFKSKFHFLWCEFVIFSLHLQAFLKGSLGLFRCEVKSLLLLLFWHRLIWSKTSVPIESLVVVPVTKQAGRIVADCLPVKSNLPFARSSWPYIFHTDQINILLKSYCLSISWLAADCCVPRPSLPCSSPAALSGLVTIATVSGSDLIIWSCGRNRTFMLHFTGLEPGKPTEPALR